MKVAHMFIGEECYWRIVEVEEPLPDIRQMNPVEIRQFFGPGQNHPGLDPPENVDLCIHEAVEMGEQAWTQCREGVTYRIVPLDPTWEDGGLNLDLTVSFKLSRYRVAATVYDQGRERFSIGLKEAGCADWYAEGWTHSCRPTDFLWPLRVMEDLYAELSRLHGFTDVEANQFIKLVPMNEDLRKEAQA